MELSLAAAAAEVSQRPALIAGDVTLTYGEVAARLPAVLGWLRCRGVEATTTRVALVGESRPGAAVLVYALAGLGVPMVMIHPRSTAQERRRVMAATATEILLEAPDVEALVEDGGAGDASAEDGSATRDGVSRPRTFDAERPLAIVQTSGTGGRPKGVVLSRRAFVAAAAASAANLGWRDDDRWLLSLPIAHVGGLSILTRCLIARRTAVLEPWRRFEASRAVRVIEERRVTLISLVPTMLQRLLALEGWQPPRRLRAILLGGAAASPDLLGRAAERGWPVLATYGLTEACSQVATQPLDTAGTAAAGHGALGCGPPVAGMQVRIRDRVIEVRGASLMSGYLPTPPESPFAASGWFRTGDLGRLDTEGRLHVLGRRDEVIVSGGENVHPLEVEAVLEQHPAITAACVFGLADEEWGEVVAAALVAPSPPSEDELLRYLAARLAPYKRPRRLAILPQLPRSVAGKVDRRRAAELAAPVLRPASK